MRHTHKRRLPIEGLSDTEETLLQMIIALTSQLSVVRERLDTVEMLLTEKDIIAPSAIEDCVLDDVAMQRRNGLREALISKVMQPIAAGLESDLARLEEEHA